MSYEIKVENKYINGDSLEITFNSKASTFFLASKETDVEVFEARLAEGRDPFEKPNYSRTTYTPTKG